MVDISEEITAITSGRYGEDVRTALASAAVKLVQDANDKLTSMQDTENQIKAIIHGSGGDDSG